MRKRLSDAFVRNITVDRVTRYFEHVTKGASLCLTVGASGSKSWSVMLYTRGRGRLFALGRFPQIGLSRARHLALGAHAAPKDFHALKSANTLREAVHEWHVRAVARGVVTANRINERVLVYAHALLDRQMSDIDRDDLVSLRERIAQGGIKAPKIPNDTKRRRQVLRGGRRTADTVMVGLRSVFVDYAEHHSAFRLPFAGLSLKSKGDPGDGERDRVLSDGEIVRLWPASEDLDKFAAFVRFLLLTAMRSGAARSLQWRDYDEKTGMITVRSERRAKPTVGAFVASPQVRQLLAQLPRTDAKIFPGLDTRLSNAKRRLDARMKPDSGWVLHDLRRSAASLMARLGEDELLIERALGHTIKISGTAKVYNRHKYTQPKSQALARLADFVDNITRGEVNDDSNVIPLHRTA